MNNANFLLCPNCNNKTRIKILQNTTLSNFPLYCPKCKKETLVDVDNFNISILDMPDIKTQNLISYRDFTMKLDQRKVFANEQEIYLTRKEFDLFHLFLENQGAFLTYEQLLANVWGEEYYDSTTNALGVLVSRLRKKLGIDSLKNVHDLGYCLEA